MRDPDVCDILVNGPRAGLRRARRQARVDAGRLPRPTHLLQIIDRIVSRVGRRIDESSPMVDARLPDGSRVNAIIPPLALDGPLLSIRRFGRDPLTVDDLVGLGSLTPEMAARAARRWCGRGSTSWSPAAPARARRRSSTACRRSSPTPSASSPSRTRPSCSSSSRTSCRLETRPANIEGRGEITQRDLVRNTLRMRPDRIIVGECRGAEALDMLQAMNTGHDGSISTVHANSPRDALSRLETMMQMAGFDLPSKAMRQQVSQALDVIVQTARLSDGTRRVIEPQRGRRHGGRHDHAAGAVRLRARGGRGRAHRRARQSPPASGRNFVEKMKASSHDVDPSVFDYLKD